MMTISCYHCNSSTVQIKQPISLINTYLNCFIGQVKAKSAKGVWAYNVDKNFGWTLIISLVDKESDKNWVGLYTDRDQNREQYSVDMWLFCLVQNIFQC